MYHDEARVAAVADDEWTAEQRALLEPLAARGPVLNIFNVAIGTRCGSKEDENAQLFRRFSVTRTWMLPAWWPSWNTSRSVSPGRWP